MAVPRRVVEGGRALGLLLVDRGAGIEQALQARGVAVLRGEHHGSDAVGARRVGGDALLGEQHLGAGDRAVLTGNMQRTAARLGRGCGVDRARLQQRLKRSAAVGDNLLLDRPGEEAGVRWGGGGGSGAMRPRLRLKPRLGLSCGCAVCGCSAAPAEADLGSVAVGPPPRRRSRAGRGWLDEMAAAVSTPSIWSVARMPVVVASSDCD